MARVSGIGLDIGSSAVRAAEVSMNAGQVEVSRFGQVGLPPGAVVEGEIRDATAVTSALRRLWAEGGFTSKDVVLGISSQRAMVRPMDVPSMDAGDMRSALRFQVAELLPIPIEQAVFDFAVLGGGNPAEGGNPEGGGGQGSRVLVVAAQKDIVNDVIAVVAKAGLKVRSVDASPLALLRAIPPSPGGGLEAVVSLGAQLVVVGVRQGSTPRFLRTVTCATEAVREAAAEPARVAQGNGGTQVRGPVLAGGLEPVIEEVRGSLEYFLSHNHGDTLESVVVTGGAALADGVIERIQAAVGVPVALATVAVQANPDRLLLDEAQMREAQMRWATAVGLALWGTGTVPSPSLLPIEIRQRRQFQRALVASGAGLAVIAVGLGFVSVSKAHTASGVRSQIASANAEATALNTEISKLQYVTQLRQDVAARRTLAVTALQGDIAWVPLVERVGAALPPYAKVTSMSFSRDAVSSTSTPAATTAPGTDGTNNFVGTVTLAGTTSAGAGSVARIIDKLAAVPGIGAVWVPSTQAQGDVAGSGGQGELKGRGAKPKSSSATAVTFSVEAVITSSALSTRSTALPGGTK